MNPTKIAVSAKRDPGAGNIDRVSSPTNSRSRNDSRKDSRTDSRRKSSRRVSFFSANYGRLFDSTESEALCKRLGMSRNDVRHLRRQFDEEDGAHSDTVTMRGFFHLIQNDDKAFERSQLVIKELLRLANVTTQITRMTFDQYLRIVCTFAAFTESQLWNFIYETYSAKRAGGDTPSNRLGALLQSAGGSYAHNIEVATRHFAANAKSPQTGVPLTITFDEFLELVHRNPVVFFPVVKLQRTVRIQTLGEKYWERKAREQLLVPPLLAYLRVNRGKLPRLSFKEWAVNALLCGNTVMARARTFARRQYLEEVTGARR